MTDLSPNERHDKAGIEIENTGKSPFSGQPGRFKEWEINSLVDYIVETHHAYTRKTIPVLLANAEEVVKDNQKDHPELSTISRLINEVCTELISHIMREETTLFPFIKKYLSAKDPNNDLKKEQIENIQSIINKMELEHDVFGRKMDMIRVLSGNYILPPDASESYSQLFKLLKEFENDFFIHLHLENHILFPKVSAMEQK